MYICQIFSNKGIKLRRKNYVCCLSLNQRPNDIEIYKTLKKKAGKYQSSKQCFTFFSNAQKHVRKRYRPADFFKKVFILVRERLRNSLPYTHISSGRLY